MLLIALLIGAAALWLGAMVVVIGICAAARRGDEQMAFAEQRAPAFEVVDNRLLAALTRG